MQQGTQEWLNARCGLFTASRFADLLAKTKTGVSASRANYIAQVLCERLTGKVAETYINSAMQTGTEREPLARALYEAQTGVLVQEVGFIQHDTLPCGASPDGLIGDDGGIEIKCPQPAAHLDYLLDANAPAKYIAQIQGCLWITGRKWWDFVSFNPDFPENLQLKVVRVMRDEEFIRNIENEIIKSEEDVTKKIEAVNKIAA